MPVNFIGPIPPTVFVKGFMKCDDVRLAPRADNINIPSDGIEGDMYTPFVSVLSPSSDTHIYVRIFGAMQSTTLVSVPDSLWWILQTELTRMALTCVLIGLSIVVLALKGGSTLATWNSMERARLGG